MSDTAEHLRLQDVRSNNTPWLKWGPYLSERQWGTVREDYSHDGNAWDYFTHDQSRSRAYRWGEDGIGGISDDHQRLCFAVAMWNGKDPTSRSGSRQTNAEGNMGRTSRILLLPRLDADPLDMKFLYKYPRLPSRTTTWSAQPHPAGNGAGVRADQHGVFATIGTSSLRRVCEASRKTWSEGHGAQPRPTRPGCTCSDALVPQTGRGRGRKRKRQAVAPRGAGRPGSKVVTSPTGMGAANSPAKGRRRCCSPENDTNESRLWGKPNPGPYVKDGINDYFIKGMKDTVNPAQTGTKVAHTTT